MKNMVLWLRFYIYLHLVFIFLTFYFALTINYSYAQVFQLKHLKQKDLVSTK